MEVHKSHPVETNIVALSSVTEGRHLLCAIRCLVFPPKAAEDSSCFPFLTPIVVKGSQLIYAFCMASCEVIC